MYYVLNKWSVKVLEETYSALNIKEKLQENRTCTCMQLFMQVLKIADCFYNPPPPN